jgi:hypothetical protein
MHCSACERSQPVNGDVGSTGGRSRLERLGMLCCERCGEALAHHSSTENFLAKLSQLARFGLCAGDRPILAEARRYRFHPGHEPE